MLLCREQFGPLSFWLIHIKPRWRSYGGPRLASLISILPQRFEPKTETNRHSVATPLFHPSYFCKSDARAFCKSDACTPLVRRRLALAPRQPSNEGGQMAGLDAAGRRRARKRAGCEGIPLPLSERVSPVALRARPHTPATNRQTAAQPRTTTGRNQVTRRGSTPPFHPSQILQTRCLGALTSQNRTFLPLPED
jgi:hypothetical protein